MLSTVLLGHWPAQGSSHPARSRKVNTQPHPYSNTLFTRSKNYLDCDLDCNLDHDPEDVPIYTGQSLFNTTKRITLFFIVQSLLHRNPLSIWIKIIYIAIHIECLHKTKFLDPDRYLDCDLNNFALCKQGRSLLTHISASFLYSK